MHPADYAIVIYTGTYFLPGRGNSCLNCRCLASQHSELFRSRLPFLENLYQSGFNRGVYGSNSIGSSFISKKPTAEGTLSISPEFHLTASHSPTMIISILVTS